MTLLDNVSRNLRRLIKKAGFLDVEFAEKVGVHHSVMSRWLNGKAAPRFTNLDKMAKLLGVAVDELTRTPDAPTVNFTQQEMEALVNLMKAGGKDVEQFEEFLAKGRASKPTKKK